jgi:hypothetical protein
MVTSAIIPAQSSNLSANVPNLDTIQAVWKLAELASKSGMSKAKTAQDAFFIAMYGLELGIPPMTSLRTIYSVSGGVPTCSGEAMLALIRRSGKVRVSISDNAETLKNGKAVVSMKRLDSGDEYTAIWGRDDDARAKLNSNRDKYPAQMWTWRAVSIAAKALCSDIIGGLYTVEELAPNTELDENGAPVGEIIEGEIQVMKQQPTPEKVVTLPTPPEEPPHPVITTQEAKETLGNGTNRRIVTDASNMNGSTQWANPTTLDQLYEAVAKRIEGISHSEILRYASVDKWNNEKAWNAKFNSGKEAVAHILKSWEVDAQPPAKGWTEDEKAIFANWIMDNFGKSVEQVEREMEVTFYSAYKSPIDATHAIVQRATQEQWDVCSTVAFYNGQYIDFKTAVGMIRVYGRSTEFKKSVGEAYYSANHIESWVTDNKPKAVAPVRLKWAVKGEGDKSYYISDKGQQTPAEAAPVAAGTVEIPDDQIPF